MRAAAPTPFAGLRGAEERECLHPATQASTRTEYGQELLDLLEHLPDRLAVHEIQYDGPNDVTASERFQRMLDPTGEVSGPTLP